MRPRIYLAGPEVFWPEGEAILRARAARCQRLGLEALVPIDPRLSSAAEIFAANCALLGQADAVIANISPFRGPHCDVGTAWEIGHAVARGLAVFAFTGEARSLAERVAIDAATGRDPGGAAVEDFGLADNLMIALSLAGGRPFGSFEEAARAAAERFSA